MSLVRVFNRDSEKIVLVFLFANRMDLAIHDTLAINGRILEAN